MIPPPWFADWLPETVVLVNTALTPASPTLIKTPPPPLAPNVLVLFEIVVAVTLRLPSG